LFTFANVQTLYNYTMCYSTTCFALPILHFEIH
jgi:hypothetical protein